MFCLVSNVTHYHDRYPGIQLEVTKKDMSILYTEKKRHRRGCVWEFLKQISCACILVEKYRVMIICRIICIERKLSANGILYLCCRYTTHTGTCFSHRHASYLSLLYRKVYCAQPMPFVNRINECFCIILLSCTV